MKISDLVPNLYNNNIEMNNIIYSEEKELEENLKSKINNSFLDTFASKATESGIEKFEKIFDIKSNPYTEELNFRRERIMNRLVSSIPYTEKYLINRLNSILGEGNWNYVIDYANYKLTINSLIPGDDWYREILDFLNKIIPCNMDWSLNVYQATWGIVKDSFATWNDISTMSWEDVMAGEYIE